VVKLTKVDLRQTEKWVQQKSHDSSPDTTQAMGVHREASEAERADKDEAEIEVDTNSSTETSNGSEADQDYDDN
jgi:hypothetical protein